MIFPKLKYLIIACLFILLGCLKSEDDELEVLPDYLDEIENLKIIDNKHEVPSHKLKKIAVYESADDIYIGGYITKLAIDKDERVYIGATRMGYLSIYVFNKSGDFIEKLSRYGRGPGEYESIGSIEVTSDRLYVFCSVLQKIGVFSIENFEHVQDIKMDRSKIPSDNKLSRLRSDRLFVPNDDVFIIRSQSLAIYSESDYPYVLFNHVTDDGIILPDKILQSERFKLYFPANEGSNVPFPMPFTRSFLVSMSVDSKIYGAWSDKFLINKYDLNGNHIESWYFPITNSTMNLRNLNLSQYRENTLNRYNDIPDTWPILHKMSVDNTGNLWVSTITESDSTYTWYVLNKDAEIESSFIHPGSRSSRSAMTDYILEVKNDFVYLQERDIQKGIERIVKYQLVSN